MAPLSKLGDGISKLWDVPSNAKNYKGVGLEKGLMVAKVVRRGRRGVHEAQHQVALELSDQIYVELKHRDRRKDSVTEGVEIHQVRNAKTPRGGCALGVGVPQKGGPQKGAGNRRGL